MKGIERRRRGRNLSESTVLSVNSGFGQIRQRSESEDDTDPGKIKTARMSQSQLPLPKNK